jgi:two-component system sensor histidine kinase PilS (NtrC family)
MESNEQKWLAWLVKVRIVIITFLLGIELAAARLTAAQIPEKLFITIIALWYTIAVFYILLLRSWKEFRVQARLQVLTDVVLAAALLYVTGGIDTPFHFLYPLIIITAAILLPRYWAYLTASVAFILVSAILELTYFRIIRSYSPVPTALKNLQLTVVVDLFAFLTIAHLASSLMSKLRKADLQLQEKSGALQELQALHQNIVQSMSGGLITTDLEGGIQIINPAGERLLGQSREGLVGCRIEGIFPEGLPRLGEARRELEYAAPDGAAKAFGMTVCELTGSDRSVAGRVYTFTDLTEIRRLETEVRVRDRMAAVGRLASGIAHEIRNPLSAIAGSAQMLCECAAPGLAGTEDARSLLDIIRRESERLNKIVKDFLAYSRSQPYHFEEHDVVQLVDETLRLLANRPECAQSMVRIVRRFEAAEAVAQVDGDRMRQVFWNLCDNALRAMPDGGVLRVSVRAAADEIQVMFADSGKGIDPPHLEKIFEPFQAQFAKGTGLGLAIVYQIIQAHDGRVSVQSAPGKGTVFTLHLKRQSVKAVSFPSSAVRRQPSAIGRPPAAAGLRTVLADNG